MLSASPFLITYTGKHCIWDLSLIDLLLIIFSSGDNQAFD